MKPVSFFLCLLCAIGFCWTANAGTTIEVYTSYEVAAVADRPLIAVAGRSIGIVRNVAAVPVVVVGKVIDRKPIRSIVAVVRERKPVRTVLAVPVRLICPNR